MLDGRNIHNSAILEPNFVRCESFMKFKRHAYAPVTGKNYEQCIDCGKIKPKDK
jgi:hypothetical protein